MFMIGALLALPLAIWRGWVAERQVKATHASVMTAQQSLSNQRLQSASQMPGHRLNAVRLGAINSIASLAQEFPDDHYQAAMSMFAAFIRRPPSNVDGGANPRLSSGATPGPKKVREDLDAALRHIGNRTEENIQFESEQKYRLDLSVASLGNIDAAGFNFRNIIFDDARFLSANLAKADFRGSSLIRCNFASAKLAAANLARANVSQANLSGRNLDKAGIVAAKIQKDGLYKSGLTQKQLDEACADLGCEPELDDSYCEDSGGQLIWRKRSCQ